MGTIYVLSIAQKKNAHSCQSSVGFLYLCKYGKENYNIK